MERITACFSAKLPVNGHLWWATEMICHPCIFNSRLLTRVHPAAWLCLLADTHLQEVVLDASGSNLCSLQCRQEGLTCGTLGVHCEVIWSICFHSHPVACQDNVQGEHIVV